MEALESMLKAWQLHPVADHFTIALLVVGVLTDLVASLIPSRQWIRNMAVTLMLLGAGAAFASHLTGEAEADRIWDMLSPAAKDYFERPGTITHHFGHGALGHYLTYVFAALAIWRLAIETMGFMNGTRSLYLIVAVIGAALLIYQGRTGGALVYTYGVGTGPMAPGATPATTGPTPQMTANALSPTPAAVASPPATPPPAPIATRTASPPPAEPKPAPKSEASAAPMPEALEIKPAVPAPRQSPSAAPSASATNAPENL
jgi:uncharacterized membrane protein